MAYSLGTAQGDIQVDIGGAEASLRTLGTRVDTMARQSTRSIGTVNKGFSLLRTAVLGVGTAVTAGLGARAVKVASDFRLALNQAGTVAKATADEYGEMQAKALQLGKDTSFSAKESAGAFLELARSGFTARQSIEGVAAVVNLAAAAQTDMATSAEVASDLMTAFRLEATDLDRIVNSLAGSTLNSAQSFEDLIYSSRYAAPSFAAAGWSVENMATALAAMASEGIKGSQAGTTLRQVVTRMVKPVGEAADLMDSLGINIADSAGNFKPFEQVIGEVNAALTGMSDTQRQAALATIFGVRAMDGANILFSNTADTIADLAAKVNEQGQATKVAEATMQGLGGALRYFSGSVETAMIRAILPLEAEFDTLIRGAADAAVGIGTNLAAAIEKLKPPVAEGWGNFQAFLTDKADYIKDVRLAIAPEVSEGWQWIKDWFAETKTELAATFKLSAPGLSEDVAWAINWIKGDFEPSEEFTADLKVATRTRLWWVRNWLNGQTPTLASATASVAVAMETGWEWLDPDGTVQAVKELDLNVQASLTEGWEWVRGWASGTFTDMGSVAATVSPTLAEGWAWLKQWIDGQGTALAGTLGLSWSDDGEGGVGQAVRDWLEGKQDGDNLPDLIPSIKPKFEEGWSWLQAWLQDTATPAALSATISVSATIETLSQWFEDWRAGTPPTLADVQAAVQPTFDAGKAWWQNWVEGTGVPALENLIANIEAEAKDAEGQTWWARWLAGTGVPVLAGLKAVVTGEADGVQAWWSDWLAGTKVPDLDSLTATISGSFDSAQTWWREWGEGTGVPSLAGLTATVSGAADSTQAWWSDWLSGTGKPALAALTATVSVAADAASTAAFDWLTQQAAAGSETAAMALDVTATVTGIAQWLQDGGRSVSLSLTQGDTSALWNWWTGGVQTVALNLSQGTTDDLWEWWKISTRDISLDIATSWIGDWDPDVIARVETSLEAVAGLITSLGEGSALYAANVELLTPAFAALAVSLGAVAITSSPLTAVVAGIAGLVALVGKIRQEHGDDAAYFAALSGSLAILAGSLALFTGLSAPVIAVATAIAALGVAAVYVSENWGDWMSALADTEMFEALTTAVDELRDSLAEPDDSTTLFDSYAEGVLALTDEIKASAGPWGDLKADVNAVIALGAGAVIREWGSDILGFALNAGDAVVAVGNFGTEIGNLAVAAIPQWLKDLFSGQVSNLTFTWPGLPAAFTGWQWPGIPAWLTGWRWPTLPTFSWPSLPAFTWPALPGFTWPAFAWPALPTFAWPSLPTFKWPTLPSALTGWQWPSLPAFAWPAFRWPDLPTWSWPAVPAALSGWQWPSLPAFAWPSLPTFRWPSLPTTLTGWQWPTLPAWEWPGLPVLLSDWAWPSLPLPFTGWAWPEPPAAFAGWAWPTVPVPLTGWAWPTVPETLTGWLWPIVPQDLTGWGWPTVPVGLTGWQWPTVPMSFTEWGWPTVPAVFTGWQWPGLPAAFTGWQWPGIPSWLDGWRWPRLEAPNWVERLFRIEDDDERDDRRRNDRDPYYGQPSGNDRPWWQFWGHAAGTGNSPGGWRWVGERGPELMQIPVGSQVRSAPESAFASRSGGEDGNITVNINTQRGEDSVRKWREWQQYSNL